jgi:hypothetical protein
MPTDQTQAQTQSVDQNQVTTNQDSQTKVDGQQTQQQDEHMIPKSRFDEVNRKYKEVLAKLQEIEKAKEEEEKAKAEQLGEFEKLYRESEAKVKTLEAEHKTATERVKALESLIESMVETRLKQIPKEFHDLIPQHLAIEEKLAWIEKAQEKGIFKKEEKQDVKIGEPMNVKVDNKPDLKSMSPMAKLLAGYSRK